jgi:hypothetical protein
LSGTATTDGTKTETPEDEAAVLSIGEVSERIGLSAHTVRFYEQEGLFFAPERCWSTTVHRGGCRMAPRLLEAPLVGHAAAVHPPLRGTRVKGQ